MPVYFLSHGGGPWPWMEGNFKDAFKHLQVSLENLPQELPEKPKAILMISGHWEAPDFKIMANPHPGMLYDYGGFPEHTYKVQYPAPGSPELAHKLHSILTSSGFKASLDSSRGFDHGTFVPLAVSFPAAEIPVVQLSLQRDYDPATHIKVGQVLASLRDEGILIIGSGLSYHNLRMFDSRAVTPSREFDQWLQETLIGKNFEERKAGLINWEEAPSARIAHPQEDHLLPLMVVVGAAGEDQSKLHYHEDNLFGGITASSFKFS